MVVPSPRLNRAAVRRLLATVAVAALVATGGILANGGAGAVAGPASVPVAHCGPGSKPETSTQGRVPRADYASGRVRLGYSCNTVEVGHQGSSGGFKTLRYTDAQGHTCAFYDSTLTVPRDVVSNTLSGDGLGVVVLDMTHPAAPRKTANLVSIGMISPHESLLVNAERGLLVGVMGTALTAPGILDVYDVKTDCRHPKLLSESLNGILGHESGFSPDGRTYYVAGVAGTLTAVDLTNPRHPRILWKQGGVVYHGLRLSDDGRRMYVANIGRPGPGGITGAGLRILDVSQIQDRRANPKVSVLSTITWHNASIPQVAEPFTRNGHHYVFEVDEFVDLFSFKGLADIKHAPVGAARIIDVQDARHPFVVSDVRLKVHQPDQRGGPQYGDPGANVPVQGYAAHYCGLPTRVNPKIAACSMILSGLRFFDIRDVRHPREVAYFNKPVPKVNKAALIPAIGSWAMSQPAWDLARNEVWYTDSNSGFYVVKLTNGVQNLLHR
ncbi:MAG: LVIVD repeat-containing protein [Marmoricola sp.]